MLFFHMHNLHMIFRKFYKDLFPHKYHMIIETITIGASGLTIFIVWKIFKRRINLLQIQLKELNHKLKSNLVRFGITFEKYTPYTKFFPGSIEDTQFMGKPIDYVVFDQDFIYFIEVKTGESKLSPKQKRIKRQIEDGKVKFKEVRY